MHIIELKIEFRTSGTQISKQSTTGVTQPNNQTLQLIKKII